MFKLISKGSNSYAVALSEYSHDDAGNVVLTSSCVTYDELEYCINELIYKLESLLDDAPVDPRSGVLYETGIDATGYTGWLLEQKTRDDPVGDLARDVEADSRWPGDVEYGAMLRYLSGQNACDGAFETLAESWREWQRSKKSDDRASARPRASAQINTSGFAPVTVQPNRQNVVTVVVTLGKR